MYSASSSSDINESTDYQYLYSTYSEKGSIPALKAFKAYNSKQKTIKHVIGKLIIKVLLY